VGPVGGALGAAWLERMKARRDLNLRLRWAHLRFMLRRIARVDKNMTAWKLMFGQHTDFYSGGLVWEVGPGGRLARRAKV
jgi:hypothetical protein